MHAPGCTSCQILCKISDHEKATRVKKHHTCTLVKPQALYTNCKQLHKSNIKSVPCDPFHHHTPAHDIVSILCAPNITSAYQ